MWRFLSLSLLVSLILFVPPAARADDDEPTSRGRKLSEWIVRLRGDKARADRRTALLALGCTASHPSAWKWQIIQREAACYALEDIGPQKSSAVFPALLAALHDDPEENIRALAAQSLGRLGGKVHADTKAGTITKPIKLDDVRDGLAAALASDKSPKVREASGRALGKLGSDGNEAVPKLVAALKDAHEGTQEAAAESLRMIAADFTESLAIRESLPRLEDVLKDPNAGTLARTQVAITMGIIRQDVNAKVVADLLKDSATPDDLRITLARTLGKLADVPTNKAKAESVAALKDVLAAKDGPTLELRLACVAALDTFGPDAKPALPELMKALHDKDVIMRTSSMHAIGRIGAHLGSESKEVVKELLAMTKESTFEVRLAAIETLGNLGPNAIGDDLPDVLKRLTELSKDNDRAVKESAADAMKKLKPSP